MKCAKFGSHNYHEDFLMPGIFPSSASSRKQMRQRLKSRIKPRGRPHLKQRRTIRLENFGFRFALTIIDFLAMKYALKGGFGVLASGLSVLDYGNPITCPVSRSILADFLKNKAPYEAHEI